LVQPLFSEFKPHWAFIVWWPVLLAGVWYFSRKRELTLKLQTSYGLLMVAAIWLSCLMPLGMMLMKSSGNSLLDVSNDLYGWSGLKEAASEPLPVIGSRYQTASQAAFALGKGHVVALIPRDAKARDEWPEGDFADGFGPDWPKLLKPVY
jgi:hypothetical protein